MKRVFGLMLACALTVTPAFCVPQVLDLGTQGTLRLEAKAQEGSIAHFDRLLLTSGIASAAEQQVFDSEGQQIIDLQAVDLDNNGTTEVLVTMDTGGSGGYIEYVLLTAQENSLKVVWEGEAFKDGKARLEDATGDGKKDVIISHLPSEQVVKPDAKRLETVFQFVDGKVVPLAGDAPEPKPAQE